VAKYLFTAGELSFSLNLFVTLAPFVANLIPLQRNLSVLLYFSVNLSVSFVSSGETPLRFSGSQITPVSYFVWRVSLNAITLTDQSTPLSACTLKAANPYLY